MAGKRPIRVLAKKYTNWRVVLPGVRMAFGMVEFAVRPPMAASSHMTRGSSPESQAGSRMCPRLPKLTS